MPSSIGQYPLITNAAVTGPATEWPGGSGTFVWYAGTPGGATVKLQWSPDGTNWLDADKSGDTYVTLTALGAGNFDLPPCQIRAAVTGGAPAALYVQAGSF